MRSLVRTQDLTDGSILIITMQYFVGVREFSGREKTIYKRGGSRLAIKNS